MTVHAEIGWDSYMVVADGVTEVETRKYFRLRITMFKGAELVAYVPRELHFKVCQLIYQDTGFPISMELLGILRKYHG